ncbi:MAG: hypothetical protein FGM52_13010 [Mycobacterium sp.]|nr:hypothetical protein [Mycobacterium sp.]
MRSARAIPERPSASPESPGARRPSASARPLGLTAWVDPVVDPVVDPPPDPPPHLPLSPPPHLPLSPPPHLPPSPPLPRVGPVAVVASVSTAALTRPGPRASRPSGARVRRSARDDVGFASPVAGGEPGSSETGSDSGSIAAGASSRGKTGLIAGMCAITVRIPSPINLPG